MGVANKYKRATNQSRDDEGNGNTLSIEWPTGAKSAIR